MRYSSSLLAMASAAIAALVVADRVVATQGKMLAVGANRVERLVVWQREWMLRVLQHAVRFEIDILRARPQLCAGRFARVMTLVVGDGAIRRVVLHCLVREVDIRDDGVRI